MSKNMYEKKFYCFEPLFSMNRDMLKYFTKYIASYIALVAMVVVAIIIGGTYLLSFMYELPQQLVDPINDITVFNYIIGAVLLFILYMRNRNFKTLYYNTKDDISRYKDVKRINADMDLCDFKAMIENNDVDFEFALNEYTSQMTHECRMYFMSVAEPYIKEQKGLIK